MLMTRSRKMYHAIEMILTIIKLIEKLKVADPGLFETIDEHLNERSYSPKASPKLGLRSSSPASRRFNKNPALVKNLKARIRCHIKSFLA